MKSIGFIAAIVLICLCLIGCGEQKKITYMRIPQPDGTYKLGICDPELGCYIVEDGEAFDANAGRFALPTPRLSAD
jgi:hypothetical protein